ncbi:hypothetical protein GOBAR_AA15433 [Gossypium barbadense]|uniref:Uncharacterized protein n=1 Tax=Gossypium barbadense TaxID=3634 RepID=A0A2P5XPI8_GOSBA|nr:hypothetical protein GOBAR_AA15433 [Gossypium barbadense]
MLPTRSGNPELYLKRDLFDRAGKRGINEAWPHAETCHGVRDRCRGRQSSPFNLKMLDWRCLKRIGRSFGTESASKNDSGGLPRLSCDRIRGMEQRRPKSLGNPVDSPFYPPISSFIGGSCFVAGGVVRTLVGRIISSGIFAGSCGDVSFDAL